MPEVRLIDDEGKQVGVLKTADALVFAQERELDLVEVAPEARPPVCRVLDYSKYKYEQAQKLKQARKHQQQITVREIKFRPKIAEHDYDTKKHHVERFLLHKDKVKVTIMFRGREMSHPERGRALLERLAVDVSELGVIESAPIQDGRNMVMLLAPVRELPPTKPGANEAPEAGAEASKPEAAKSEAAPPEAAEPEAVKAETPAPKATASKAAPKAAAPKAAKSRATKPKPAAPEVEEPTVAAAEVAEPAVAAPEPEPEPTST